MNQIKVNGATYRQRFNTCNKPGCKCLRGEKHGPYWYEYRDGSTPKYVGTILPKAITDHIALLKTSMPKIKKLRTDLQKKRDDLYQQQRELDMQIRTINSLEAGEYTASDVLKKLGMAQFNGHSDSKQ